MPFHKHFAMLPFRNQTDIQTFMPSCDTEVLLLYLKSTFLEDIEVIHSSCSTVLSQGEM